MIVLFTDFGWRGPYVGQMQGVLQQLAPGIRVIELFNDAPVYNPMAAAHLLAAYVGEFPAGTIFLGVVDPGVGSERKPVMVEVDGRRFVGPDNGLFNVVAARASEVKWWDITWRPERLSASFHGRDLFAPVAAMLSVGQRPSMQLLNRKHSDDARWRADLPEIIYLDHFGNAMTGLRAANLAPDAVLKVSEHRFRRQRTFSDVAEGDAFWYENANGMAEIAVNRGNAAEALCLALGLPVAVETN